MSNVEPGMEKGHSEPESSFKPSSDRLAEVNELWETIPTTASPENISFNDCYPKRGYLIDYIIPSDGDGHRYEGTFQGRLKRKHKYPGKIKIGEECPNLEPFTAYYDPDFIS